MKKRVLLMYISKNSGHHHASLALEKAFHQLSDDVETLNIDSFHYTNPIFEKIINKLYMSVIKRKPEFWGHIYDNPQVVRRTQKLKESIHKYNSGKMKDLLDDFKPQAVVCTQAFPCGIVADYKKNNSTNITLVGVLTDYAPHSYWVYDNVDHYFVPSAESKERLVEGGVLEDRVVVTGIPIDPKFRKVTNKEKVINSLKLSSNKPIILVMGGSQGIGPIKEIMKALSNSKLDFQIIVITGTNKKLYRYLEKKSHQITKRTVVLGYSDNINELMEISTVVISKPGGVTISEAFAKSLPVFIIKPIPGQERLNADHLVKYKVGININNLQDTEIFLKELLLNSSALNNMRNRAKAFSKPNSALDIASTVLERIM